MYLNCKASLNILHTEILSKIYNVCITNVIYQQIQFHLFFWNFLFWVYFAGIALMHIFVWIFDILRKYITSNVHMWLH